MEDKKRSWSLDRARAHVWGLVLQSRYTCKVPCDAWIEVVGPLESTAEGNSAKLVDAATGIPHTFLCDGHFETIDRSDHYVVYTVKRTCDAMFSSVITGAGEHFDKLQLARYRGWLGLVRLPKHLVVATSPLPFRATAASTPSRRARGRLR